MSKIFYMETKTTKLSKISNTLFLTAIIFCLFFLWCNFYTKSLKISFFSSIIISICFLILFVIISNYLSKRKSKSIEKTNSIEKFKLNLMYSQVSNVLNLLKSMLNFTSNKEIEKKHFLLDNQKDLFIFLQENISQNDIQSIFQNRQTNEIIIVSISKFDLPINIDKITIEFIDLQSLYLFCQENSINTLLCVNHTKKPKYRLKDIFCIVLNKEKSKSYFWLGIVLLFSSLFTPFSTYYIVVSTILFLLSLFSRFNKIFNKKTQ